LRLSYRDIFDISAHLYTGSSVGSVSYPRAMEATATRDMAASFSVEQQVVVE